MTTFYKFIKLEAIQTTMLLIPHSEIRIPKSKIRN